MKDKRELAKLALKAGTRIATKIALEKAKPHISSVLSVITIGGSWAGLFPNTRVTLDKAEKCSICGNRRKELLIVFIPWTGGRVKICKYCEKREIGKLGKFLKSIKKTKKRAQGGKR